MDSRDIAKLIQANEKLTAEGIDEKLREENERLKVCEDLLRKGQRMNEIGLLARIDRLRTLLTKTLDFMYLQTLTHAGCDCPFCELRQAIQDELLEKK